MSASRKGFTIVELVIVIAVIAILAAVLVPTFSGIIERANQSAALQEARNTLTMTYGQATGGALPEKRADGTYRAMVLVSQKSNEAFAFGCCDGSLESVTTEAIAEHIAAGRLNAVLLNAAAINENGYAECAQRPADWDVTYKYYSYKEGGVYRNFDGDTAPGFSPCERLNISLGEKFSLCLAPLFGGESVELYKNASGYLIKSGTVTLYVYTASAVSPDSILFSDAGSNGFFNEGSQSASPSQSQSPAESSAEESIASNTPESSDETSEENTEETTEETAEESQTPAAATGTLSKAPGFDRTIQFDNLTSTDWTFPLGEELEFSVQGDHLPTDYTITMGGVPLIEGADYTKEVESLQESPFEVNVISVHFTIANPTGDIVIDDSD